VTPTRKCDLVLALLVATRLHFEAVIVAAIEEALCSLSRKH
jgi:hypothetical protein